MEKNKYKIKASSIEEFNLIEEKIKKLPIQVISFIEEVEKPFDLLKIRFKQDQNDKIKLNLPIRKFNSLEVGSTGFRYSDSLVSISGTKSEKQFFEFSFYNYKEEDVNS